MVSCSSCRVAPSQGLNAFESRLANHVLKRLIQSCATCSTSHLVVTTVTASVVVADVVLVMLG